MYCKNCNAEIPDDARFCGFCATKVEEPAAGGNSPTQQAPTQQAPTQQVPTQQVPTQQVSTQQGLAIAEMPESTELAVNPIAEVTKKPRRFKKLKIALAVIVSLLAVSAIVVFAFGKAIFFKVSPEKYVAYLFNNTIKACEKDFNKIEKNLFGFDITMDKDFSVTMDVKIENPDEDVKAKMVATNNSKDKNLVTDIDVSTDGSDWEANAFIDNENAGLLIDGSEGKYLTVPSKNFGKEYKGSKGYAREYLRENATEIDSILCNLDLSYDSIKELMSPDSSLAKSCTDHLKNNIIEFLGKTEIGKRKSVKYKFDNGTVSANEITLKTDAETILKTVENFLLDLRRDEEYTKKFGVEITDQLLDNISSAIEELHREMDGIPCEIVLTEYNGKIVSISVTLENKRDMEGSDHINSHMTLSLGATDKKHILNGLKITSNTKSKRSYDGEKSKHQNNALLEFSSNWCSDSKKIQIFLNSESDYVSEYDDDRKYKNGNSASIEFILDFNSNNWDLDTKSKWSYSNSDGETDGDSSKDSYNGTCSKGKDGFTFVVDEKGESESQSDAETRTKVEISILPKAIAEKKNASYTNILKWSEEDFTDFEERYEDELEE